LDFSKNISILYGHNNIGKTTILEAIYFCSNLKSFKQLPNVGLINSSSTSFKISLKCSQKSSNSNIFIEKSLKSSKCLYNNKKISKQMLNNSFPCYALVFGFNNLLLNDSSYRRDFIDSGMFHVEPKSHTALASFSKALKQRNYLLKSKNLKDIDFWNSELVKYNNNLFNYRNLYFENLSEQFVSIITKLKNTLPEIYDEIGSLDITYYKGWNSDNYENELNESYGKDINVGYTTIGSHRSDILIRSNNNLVKESGSMSTLVLSCLLMFLAKSNVFHVKHGYKPVLLIDDLFFGIDNKNLNTVIKLLIYSKGNIVVTAPNIYKEILEKISSMNDEIEIINVGEY
jgi:DNA replication and repair protein RecF